MQLVSAVKMKKAQQDYVEGRPYRETLEQMIKKIIRKVNVNMSKLLRVNESKKEIYIYTIAIH